MCKTSPMRSPRRAGAAGPGIGPAAGPTRRRRRSPGGPCPTRAARLHHAVERDRGPRRQDQPPRRRALPEGRDAGRIRLRHPARPGRQGPRRSEGGGEDLRHQQAAVRHEVAERAGARGLGRRDRQGQGRRAMADAMQSKCMVEAPFAGVVVDQKAREFQYTTPASRCSRSSTTRRSSSSSSCPRRGCAG